MEGSVKVLLSILEFILQSVGECYSDHLWLMDGTSWCFGFPVWISPSPASYLRCSTTSSDLLAVWCHDQQG